MCFGKRPPLHRGQIGHVRERARVAGEEPFLNLARPVRGLATVAKVVLEGFAQPGWRQPQEIRYVGGHGPSFLKAP